MSAPGVAARQNAYIRTFRKHGAVNPEKAKTLKKLGITPTKIFERMEKTEIFVKTEEDKYYMDEQKAEYFIMRRIKYAKLWLGIIVFAAVIIYLIYGNL